MDVHEFFESTKDSDRSPQKPIAILAGAGVSVPQPAGLPTALQLLESLVCVIEGSEAERERLLGCLSCNRSDGLGIRFEGVIEILQGICDPELDILDVFLESECSNTYHHILAGLIRQGHVVFTPNFDTLIEQACVLQRFTCMPIFNEDTLSRWQEQNLPYPLFKLHGTVNGLGAKGKLSVSTTLHEIAKEGFRFNRSSYKQKLMETVLKKSDLFVIGYSGSDDYDLVPLLTSVSTTRRLIWINHNPAMNLARNLDTLSKEDLEGTHMGVLHSLRSVRDTKDVWLLDCGTQIAIDRLAQIYGVSGDVSEATVRPNKNRLDQFMTDWAKRHLASEDPRRTVVAEILWWAGALEDARRVFEGLKESKCEQVAAHARQRTMAHFFFAGQQGVAGDVETFVKRLDPGVDGETSANISRGLKYAMTGTENAEAIECLKYALDRVTEPLLRAFLKGHLANLWMREREFETAASFLQESMKVYDDFGMPQFEANGKWAFGNIMFRLGRWREALVLFTECCDVFAWLNDTAMKAKLLSQVAAAQHKLGRKSEALKSYEESILLKEQLKDYRGLGITCYNLAQLHEEEKNYGAAKEQYEHSIYYAEKVDDLEGIGLAQQALSRLR